MSLAVLLATGVLSACGNSESDTNSTTANAAAGAYVSGRSLTQYKPDQPQHILLEWWRAVQFANAGLARGFYAAGSQPVVEELQHELAIASRQFTGVPQFSSIAEDGDKATLYFFVRPPDSDASPQALSVNLVKTSAGWRLADDQLLGQEVARAEHAAKSREE